MFTCSQVSEYYRLSAVRCEAELSGLVSAVVETAARRARGYIGTLQEGWDPLSSATIFGFEHPKAGWIVGKADRGFGPADYAPLRGDTGELEDSISASTEGLVGIVGSDSKIGLYQELGTPGAMYPIPPRSFLAKSLMETEAEIATLAGELALDLLMPKA